jgi:uncharacterized membrane protein YqjE
LEAKKINPIWFGLLLLGVLAIFYLVLGWVKYVVLVVWLLVGAFLHRFFARVKVSK